MSYQDEYINLHFEKRDHIAFITLDNPKTLNALNYDVFMGLNNIFDNIKRDEEVRGVIITGAGEKAFVAGADLSDKRMQNANFAGPEVLREVRKHIVHDCLERIVKCEKPVLAAINGYCLGGGAELAALCDFRIASTKTKIGYPEVRLGGIPAYLGVAQIMRIMNPAYAKEMLMTGKHYTAEEAKNMGFLSYVVEPEELMTYCEDFMKSIIKNAPLAIQYCKITADRCLEMSYESASALECMVAAILATTKDGAEGKAAFHEKRDPHWIGH